MVLERLDLFDRRYKRESRGMLDLNKKLKEELMTKLHKLKIMAKKNSLNKFFLFTFILIILACHSKNNSSDGNLDLGYIIPDTLQFKYNYENFILYRSIKDSLIEKEKLNSENVKAQVFVFVYKFDEKEIVPKSSESLDERKADIFTSRNDTTYINYRFDKIGKQKLLIVVLDEIYYRTETDKLRVIEKRHDLWLPVYVK